MIPMNIHHIVNEIKVGHPWLAIKYSSDTLLDRLEQWRARILSKAEESGLLLDEVEIFRHFKPYYLRLLSSDSKNGKVESRIISVLEQIKKQRILRRIYGQLEDQAILNGRQREYGLNRLEERTGLWEEMMKAQCPDISDQDMFRFFKIRYLSVSHQRFKELEIKRGIKNTLAYLDKKSRLERLFIGKSHPHYRELVNLAVWEFDRKYRSLWKAVKACKELTLNFPPIKDSTTQRELRRLLKQSRKEITKQEEMLYKLITYFQGMTLRQIENIYKTYLLNNKWQLINIQESMDRLVKIRLLERIGLDDDWYYIKTTKETQIERLLEDWIKRLRQDISIGTGEALSYLHPSHASHSLTHVEQEDIPLATQKIWEDRRGYLKNLYVSEKDPQGIYLLRQKRTELDQAVEKVNMTIKSYQDNTLTIPEGLQHKLSFYMDQELKKKDFEVFKLVYNLGTTSYEQLANILRKINHGRIGFYLKSSLKRLCEYRFIECSDEGIYRINETTFLE